MKPTQLIVKGLGPHSDTAIDFRRLASPAALVAPFGTGKTSLIEAIPFCLWGCGGWYDSIYDMLTQGGTGEGEIILEFEHGGTEYVAHRTIRETAGGTRRQTASLGERNEFGPFEPIAGPKTSDFERAICALIGDYETFLATQFLSQNRKGDLIGQPGEPDLVKRRRDVFNELIGAAGLDAHEARFSEEERARRGALNEIVAQLVDVQDPTTEIGMTGERIRRMREQIAAVEPVVQEAEAALASIRRDLATADAGDGAHRAAIERHEHASNAVAGLERQIYFAEADFHDLAKRALGIEAARADVEALADQKLLRAELEQQQNDYRVWCAWSLAAEDLERRRLALAGKIETLKSVPGCDEATIAMAATVADQVAKGAAARAENAERGIRNTLRGQHRNGWAQSAAIAARTLESIKERMAAKPVTPFGDACSPCPLMKDWADLPRQFQHLEGEVTRCADAFAAIEPDEPPTDMMPLIEAYQQAKSAADKVAAAAGAAKSIAAAELELAEAESKIALHAAVEPPQQEFNEAALAAVRAEIDRLAGAPERLKAAQQAGVDAAAKSKQLADLRGDHAQLLARAEELKPAAEAARKALADAEAHRNVLTTEEAKQLAAITAGRSSIAALRDDIATATARVHALEERGRGIAEKRERLGALESEIEALADLRRCFGSRGVRQILIDNAAPELEAIAADLFERATEGRQRLRIATQKVNADGSIAEDFRILIADERGERDALRYSGGQLQLAIILFRLAVAQWVGRIRGATPDCLILDEAFDRLGAEGTEALLSVLDHLSGQIGLIVVVTHDNLIADRLRSKVRLEKTYGGVIVHAA